MDQAKFKEIEQKYKELKERLNYGTIGPADVKKELKKMMVLDDDGKYWMIGAKTGKWYIHDGTDWREGNPYEKEPVPEETEDNAGTISLSLPGTDSEEGEESQEEEAGVKVEVLDEKDGTDILIAEEEEAYVDEIEKEAGADIPVNVEEEAYVDEIEKEAGADILVKIEEKGEPYTKKEEALPPRKVVKTKIVEKKDELIITSIKIMPLLFFLGGLGLILGVLLGAGFGIFKTILPTLQEQIPDILNDTRGEFPGGLIFAAIGGIGGFFISAAAAVLISSTYKLIAYIFGGLRLKIKQ